MEERKKPEGGLGGVGSSVYESKDFKEKGTSHGKGGEESQPIRGRGSHSLSFSDTGKKSRGGVSFLCCFTPDGEEGKTE